MQVVTSSKSVPPAFERFFPSFSLRAILRSSSMEVDWLKKKESYEIRSFVNRVFHWWYTRLDIQLFHHIYSFESSDSFLIYLPSVDSLFLFFSSSLSIDSEVQFVVPISLSLSHTLVQTLTVVRIYFLTLGALSTQSEQKGKEKSNKHTIMSRSLLYPSTIDNNNIITSTKQQLSFSPHLSSSASNHIQSFWRRENTLHISHQDDHLSFHWRVSYALLSCQTVLVVFLSLF